MILRLSASFSRFLLVSASHLRISISTIVHLLASPPDFGVVYKCNKLLSDKFLLVSASDFSLFTYEMGIFRAIRIGFNCIIYKVYIRIYNELKAI